VYGASINTDIFISEDGSLTDITFTVTIADYEKARMVLEAARESIGFQEIQGSTDVAKISVIGIGMRSHAGVAADAFKALASRSINIRAITTSEIKISVLIDAPYTELAVRTLHSLYGLDGK
jgi:aspartate kinase